MESSPVSNKQEVAPSRPSTRARSSQDYARRVATDDAVRQQERAQNNRDATRRLAQSAFRESLEEERVRLQQNMQAGVEKMVRSVVRKESSLNTGRAEAEAHQNDADTRSDVVREKLNSAYGSDNSESPRDEELRPTPSQRQQQRAIENYQQATRNSIDRTVELVV